MIADPDFMHSMETETIDRLFLELSQFTRATTAKELLLSRRIGHLRAALASMDRLDDHELRAAAKEALEADAQPTERDKP